MSLQQKTERLTAKPALVVCSGENPGYLGVNIGEFWGGKRGELLFHRNGIQVKFSEDEGVLEDCISLGNGFIGFCDSHCIGCGR